MLLHKTQLNKTNLCTKCSTLNAQEGFSLLETLVALAILTITMLGPMTLASSSIRSASLSHSNIIAAFLAEEAIETVRAKRDANIYEGNPNWLDGIEKCKVDSPCIVDVFVSAPGQVIDKCTGQCPKIKYDNTLGIYQYNSGNDTRFTRTVYVEPIGLGNKEVKVFVSVVWRERFLPSDSSVILDESLFNWK